MEELVYLHSLTDFSEEEQNKINEYIPKIELENKNFILSYAAEQQKEIGEISDDILKFSKEDYLSPVFGAIVTLVDAIKNFDEQTDMKSGIFGFMFDSNKFYNQFKFSEAIVLSSEKTLRESMRTLLKKEVQLKMIYEKLYMNYKKLAMYIVAGEMKISFSQSEELDSFKSRIQNLKISQNIANQIITQLFITRKQIESAIEKIKDVTNHTIPAWKNQVSNLLQSESKKQDLVKDISKLNNKTVNELESNLKALRN